jgi:NADH-quinone oxidoreductase subunit A
VDTWLLLPPLAFIIILTFSMLLSLISSKFACKPSSNPAGKLKAYACGENVPDHRLQPEYSQFFPFAFFFTIMHVLALIITTFPSGTGRAVGIAALYVLAAAAGLLILFRR